jgi:hypothetical protein
VRRKLSLVALVLSVVVVGTVADALSPRTPPRIPFPDGKRFAFSIIDDTDMATLERLKPIYELLERHGMRTTKTVWMYDSSDLSNPTNRGDSLRNPAYRRFILDLQQKGFEIALHGVRGGSSRREDVLRGFDEFKTTFGSYPAIYINHAVNKENIYWGSNLFTFAPYRWLGAFAIRHEFFGHDPASPYFWGDVAKERVTYVRRFSFGDPNLLRVNASFPYRLPEKPYVNLWFPTANGSRVIEFDRLLSSENIARLENEGGVCLVYAHLGSGSFNKSGGLDSRFVSRITELSARNGWFVPASRILDHMRGQPSWTGDLSYRERLRVDTRYLVEKLVPQLSGTRQAFHRLTLRLRRLPSNDLLRNI